MKHKIFITYLTIVGLVTVLNVKGQTTQEYSNTNYVPDKATAIKIAEAVWLPIYGKKIYTELPFKAILVNDSIWTVAGTLPKSSKKIVIGGTAYIEIRKSDCKILKVIHGK